MRYQAVRFCVVVAGLWIVAVMVPGIVTPGLAADAKSFVETPRGGRSPSMW